MTKDQKRNRKTTKMHSLLLVMRTRQRHLKNFKNSSRVSIPLPKSAKQRLTANLQRTLGHGKSVLLLNVLKLVLKTSSVHILPVCIHSFFSLSRIVLISTDRTQSSIERSSCPSYLAIIESFLPQKEYQGSLYSIDKSQDTFCAPASACSRTFRS